MQCTSVIPSDDQKYSKEITQCTKTKNGPEKKHEVLAGVPKIQGHPTGRANALPWEAYKALGQSPVALERQALQGQYTDALTSFLAKYKDDHVLAAGKDYGSNTGAAPDRAEGGARVAST